MHKIIYIILADGCAEYCETLKDAASHMTGWDEIEAALQVEMTDHGPVTTDAADKVADAWWKHFSAGYSEIEELPDFVRDHCETAIEELSRPPETPNYTADYGRSTMSFGGRA